MDWVALIAGSLMLLFCLVQLGLWTSQSLGRQWAERSYWALQQQWLSAKIAGLQAQGSGATREGGVEGTAAGTPEESRAAGVAWRGWRTFRIKKLVRETPSTTSVYLAPLDGLELPEYSPGQFLTLKAFLPNQSAPQIRCYSLSAAPQPTHYRITVKDVHGREGNSAGVSHTINWQWAIGYTIEIKAPGGEFYLELSGREPVILLAGGVGITPLMSMIETVLQRADRRDLLLFYGVRNSGEHIFRDRLKELAGRHANFNVLTCYSQPGPEDVAGRDYHIQGRVSLELLKRALPSPDFDFYLCGPGAFMAGLHQQLTDWGVPIGRIHYEAFGPATVVPTPHPIQHEPIVRSSDNGSAGTRVQFARTGKTIDWDGRHDNLLEAGLAAGVPLSSGCRAGQCGACQTRLLRGDVDYPGAQPLDVASGHCLPCIAVPREDAVGDEEIVLDA